jgi:hypothetical protein
VAQEGVLDVARGMLVAVVVLCIVAGAALAQAVPSAESRPAAAVAAERPTPQVAPPAPAPVAPSPATTAPRAQRTYPEWVTKQYAPWVLEYIEEHAEAQLVLTIGTLVAKPIQFLALFLGIGAAFARLAARAAGLPRSVPGRVDDDQTATRRARAATAAWACALAIACESAGLKWVGSLAGVLVGLLGSLIASAAWLAIAGLVVYAVSTQGRELVLSLLGWAYVARARQRQERAGKPEEYSLGGDARGRIAEVDPLFTTFEVTGGGRLRRPNHEVLRELFGWPPPPQAAQ